MFPGLGPTTNHKKVKTWGNIGTRQHKGQFFKTESELYASLQEELCRRVKVFTAAKSRMWDGLTLYTVHSTHCTLPIVHRNDRACHTVQQWARRLVFKRCIFWISRIPEPLPARLSHSRLFLYQVIMRGQGFTSTGPLWAVSRTWTADNNRVKAANIFPFYTEHQVLHWPNKRRLCGEKTD